MNSEEHIAASDEQNQAIDGLFRSAGDLVNTVIARLSPSAQTALAHEMRAGLTIGLFLEIHPEKRVSCFIKPPDGEARTLFTLDSTTAS